MKNLTTILLKLSFLIAFALTLSVDASAIERSSKINSTDSRELRYKSFTKKVYTPIKRQLSQKNKVRSRSEVMREVKSRYNAEVLRIKLNEKRMVYQVRVLMPNGKVKNVTVNASR